MPINDEELLAAVSGGIDSASAAPVSTETAQETTDDNDADGADDNGEGGADDSSVPNGDEPSGESDADGEGADEGTDADGEGEELGPDGKPVAKTDPKAGQADEVNPATGKPYTPEEKAAKDADEAKAAFRKLQVEDPINAPIPKYLKETTQKRMTKLVEIAKDLTAKNDAAQRDRNEILGMITETGATATQYTQALQYLKMVNSRDPAQIQAAIKVMQDELSALSRMAGVPVTGVDLLADHADLKAAVEANQITPQLAAEIAAGRNQRTHQGQVAQLTQEQQQANQREHQAGVKALNDIGRELATRDPNYRAKAAAVLQKIQGQMQKQPPSQWAQTFLVAYTTYQPPRAAAPVAKPKPAVPKNQPLRGNNPSGGQQSAPKTLEDAISMGIAAGTRR